MSCPTCCEPSKFQARRDKAFVCLMGDIVLQGRAYYYCSRCRGGHVPVDGELGLSQRRLTPGAEEVVVLLGAQHSFAEAVEKSLAKTTGLRLSESTVERATEAAGERLGRVWAEGRTLGPAADWEWNRDAALGPPPTKKTLTLPKAGGLERAGRIGYDRIDRSGDVANESAGPWGREFMWTMFWSFVIYWLVTFVGCFIVVEIAQDTLYDETTPRAGLKVGGGSFLLALLLTYFHPSFETMFTNDFFYTVFQAIVWFGVFTLILQFHPWHALGLSLLTLVLIAPLATMGVDSMLAPSAQTARRTSSAATQPVRKSLSPPPAPAPAKK